MYNYLKIDYRLRANCRVFADHDHGGVMIDADTEKERSIDFSDHWRSLKEVIFQLDYLLN